MTYWWTGIATFNYVHAVIILVSLLPFPPPRFWKRILDSCLIKFFTGMMMDYRKAYFLFFCVFLVTFIDSLQACFKYSSREYDLFGDAETRQYARIALLFAQRNYAISGAACVISLIMPRLLLILQQNIKYDSQIKSVNKATKALRELDVILRSDERQGYSARQMTNSELVEAVREALGEILDEDSHTPDERRAFRDHFERRRNDLYSYSTFFLNRVGRAWNDPPNNHNRFSTNETGTARNDIYHNMFCRNGTNRYSDELLDRHRFPFTNRTARSVYTATQPGSYRTPSPPRYPPRTCQARNECRHPSSPSQMRLRYSFSRNRYVYY